jgi:alkyl hydroperoxide reductase subunit F
MLESGMLDQLKEVFLKLTGTVTLHVAKSTHADADDLLALLNDVATTSDKIRVEVPEGVVRDAPYFEITGQQRSGVVGFRGIPTGHEFTSLILGILHADGKGKLPDAGVIERIRNLKGPIRLKTFISLTCENCPEVVQALNLMATLHPDFHHEAVDGGVAPKEVEELGIQGVPSVINEGKLLHSGKVQLVDLLSKLEEVFGKSSAEKKETNLGLFDVVVIGGGPAGASSAIYTARKGLKTALVAERFGGQLQETKGIENMISVSYTEGVRLAAQLSEHVSAYPMIQLLEHRRVNQIVAEGPEGGAKRILLESGEFLDAKAVIIATGAKWRQLGIPGEKEHIGQGVAFCAHCDGPFYKGRRVSVVGGGNSGVEAAIDLANIASHVTLFEFNDHLKADGVLVEKLKALPNAVILTNVKTTRVIGDGKKVTGLEYQDRKSNEVKTLDCDGVFVQIGLLPNTHFLKGLVELTPFGEIVVDPKGRTSVPGIYAAGDVTTIPFKQIVVAMGDGAKVALTAFEDRLHAKGA